MEKGGWQEPLAPGHSAASGGCSPRPGGGRSCCSWGPWPHPGDIGTRPSSPSCQGVFLLSDHQAQTPGPEKSGPRRGPYFSGWAENKLGVRAVLPGGPQSTEACVEYHEGLFQPWWHCPREPSSHLLGGRGPEPPAQHPSGPGKARSPSTRVSSRDAEVSGVGTASSGTAVTCPRSAARRRLSPGRGHSSAAPSCPHRPRDQPAPPARPPGSPDLARPTAPSSRAN